MAYTKETMTFEQFKVYVRQKYGCTSFREEGKYGWSSLEDILERKPGGRPGPHWCDAAPVPAGPYLIGTYNFDSGIATFYNVI